MKPGSKIGSDPQETGSATLVERESALMYKGRPGQDGISRRNLIIPQTEPSLH